MRVAIYSDGPTAPTGFGVVAKNIFMPMLEAGTFTSDDLMFFGVNYAGEPHDLPFRVWPAQIAQRNDPDLYGRSRFAELILSNALGPIDALFLLQDTFCLSWPVPINGAMQPFMPTVIRYMRQQVEAGQRPPFRVIQYIPIDAEHPHLQWIDWIPELVDYPVAYTRYGRRVMCDLIPGLSNKMGVIPHGTNPETFFSVDPQQREAFRRDVIRLKPGQPLVVNVNRNQPRKDVPRTLQVFAEVRKHVPDAVLLLHMNCRDSAGFDLDRVRQNLQIPSDAVRFPANFSEGVGVPIEVLNMIYNSADVFLTTARGGGWELSLTEAMTAGVPVVAPDHTSHHEIITDSGGGILVKPDPHRAYIVLDNDQPRPVANVTEMADAVVGLLRSPERRRVLAMRGREWSERMSWKHHVVPQWQRIFEQAAQSLGKLGQPAQPPPLAARGSAGASAPVTSVRRPASTRFQVNA